MDQKVIEAVSFDCAGTLIDVKWNPVSIAVGAAKKAGYDIDDQVAGETYHRMLSSRWKHFEELNTKRSALVTDQFWVELGKDWLVAINQPLDNLEQLVHFANDACFGEGQQIFRLYDDSLSILDYLKEKEIPIIALSNWDISLHQVVRILGIEEYFVAVIASLVEGVEKPDPALFEVGRKQLNIKTSNILHVGDDPIADVQGARNFGMQALLLDRSVEEESGSVISSLNSLKSII